RVGFLLRHEAGRFRQTGNGCYPPRVNDRRGGVMVVERPARRMTLRQQLTHAEKCSRDLVEHVQGTLLPSVADIRDLSRPVRRRSHYPAMVAILNSLKKVQQTSAQTVDLL